MNRYQMSSKVTLVTNKICPFAHRAWITLREKKVDHELREVSLTEKEPHFTEIYHKAYAHDPSSNGKVPVLIHGDHVLAESDLISWYVAETFDSGSHLIPKDTFERAKMRHFIGEVPGKVIGGFYGLAGNASKSKQEQEANLQKLDKALALLDSRIQGPFILGDQFSLADILTYPWFERWVVLEHYFNLSIDKKHQKVLKWIQAVSERESVSGTVQPKELFIEGYKPYFAKL